MNIVETHVKAEWTTPIMTSINLGLQGVHSGFGALDDGGAGVTTSTS